MKAKIKTVEKLKEEGFKVDYPYWYRGNKREADAQFRQHYVESLLGREVEILSVDSYEQGKVTVSVNGVFFEHIPLWLFEESLDITQVAKPLRKSFSWANGSNVKYYKGFRFKFPCAFDELNVKHARELATWILKVTE